MKRDSNEFRDLCQDWASGKLKASPAQELMLHMLTSIYDAVGDIQSRISFLEDQGENRR